MAYNKTTYEEIERIKVGDTKSIVISKCSKGGYTIAQQLLVVDENGNKNTVFLKGALHVNDVSDLTKMRDALNNIINKVIAENNIDWD